MLKLYFYHKQIHLKQMSNNILTLLTLINGFIWYALNLYYSAPKSLT